jgi:eukaryotic-like serine/threonine-protein kinase
MDSPPQRVGPYELLGRIAEGGMAVVYVARRGTDHVALKMIRDDLARSRAFLEMFRDEAKIVSRLVHPGIVRTFEQGDVDGHAFIAMELLAGRSLWAVWDACRARGVRLRYDMIAWIGARVAEGLHYAHELRDDEGRPLGIVHRDVNPSNIFVTDEGTIKIIDFGLAKAANRASRTATGVLKGKVAYMSPEQAGGEPVDRRTDVFALAVTLWELACDRRLFKGDDDMQTLEQVRSGHVPDPVRLVDGFPPALWDALARALARDPSARTATAADLGRALDALAGPAACAPAMAAMMRELFPPGRPATPATLASAAREPARARPRRLTPVLAIVAVLVVGLVLTAALVLR